MDKSKVKNAVEIMTAYLDEKIIQQRPKGSDNDHHWVDISEPSFNFSIMEYRIKPEPRTLYLVEWDNSAEGYVYRNKNQADAVASYDPSRSKVIELVEKI